MAFGELAGVATPTIDALINLAGISLGVDFRRTGLTLEKMGLKGKTPADLPRFLEQGM